MPSRAQQPTGTRASLRFLHRLSFDVLQRGLGPSELAAYRDAPLDVVVQRLLQSREALSVWFDEQMFYLLLIDQFRPRGDDLERIPARMQRGELTARDAIVELILSPAFSQRNPGNDTFVTVVLEQCLGHRVQDARTRPVLAAGKQLYDGRKGRFLGETGASQADLVQIAVRHVDFARHLLQREHQRLLGAPLPADHPAIARVHADWRQFFPVLAEWLQGDAYLGRLAQRQPKSERQFLRGLYQDLLQRPPTHDELRSLRNALQSMADPTPLRAVLAKVVLDSGQTQLPAFRRGASAEFVTECFARYLCRQPTERELTVFQTALDQEGGTPAQVVRALITSLEYQTY